MIDENTSRQVEELYRSDDWADLRWAREHSTPQQIARHLLDPQWRNRDYNALDELVEMTHDADLSSLDEDDLETLAASGLPELRQAVIRYAGTPARLLEDMARTESNTRLLQMLVESGKLSQNAIDLCCWNQTDSRLAASMLPKASDDLLHRLSGRDWWPSRKNAVESGRLDRKDLSDMIRTENHPEVVSALIGTGEFDMDSEAEAIRRVITSPGLLTAYTNPMNRRYSLDQSRQEVVRQAARTMLEHAPVGMILSMPDDDDENWRTLIDTAATEYAGELGKDMLGLIARSEGNTQARTILAGRGFPKAAASNAERTLAASPGADGTYGFNLRLLGRLKDDVDYFLGPSHAEKYLWAGSVDAQIAKLREIDGTIRPEDRPEWFTTEWIDQAEREMKDPSDNTETALDAALSGQYAAFENAVIGYIDAHDTDAGTSENGASQFAGYEVAAHDANGTPMAYRLDWFDDEGMVHEGPEATETELRSLREGIFDSPDSWDSFNTATDTPDTTAADTSGTAGTKPGHETGHGPQIVFTSLAGGHGMPEGTVELLSDDAARQVSDILDAGGTSGGRPERAAGQDRERRRENIDRLLDVLPVTMVTKDGNHQVTAEEVMAMADRTEHAADMAEEPETAAASSTDTPAEPFDWNGVDGLESGIRDWYSHEFPDDPEGGRIDPRTTFREAVESFPMGDGHDFYAVTGAVDSIVRERVFEELSKRLDCEYSDILDAWTRHTNLDPDLLGDKSARMRREVSDMIGDGPAAFALADSIADHVASDWRAMTVIREADRMNAIDGTDFRKGIKDAISRHPGNDRLLENDGFAGLVYDMVKDGRRFATDAPAVHDEGPEPSAIHEADVDGAPNIGEEDINVADSERKGDGVVPGAEETAEKIRMFRITVGDNVINHLRSRGADDAAIAAIADSYDLNRRNGMGRREARMAAEREHGYGATPSVTKSAEDAVDEEHLPHASNERAASDPAVRPEDGPFGDMDAAARTDASEPERAEDAPSSGMEAGTVSTPELIAKKIELFGIKVGRFEVAQLIRRGAGPEAIADIADSYDLNLRNGMESGEARLAAEREHGYAPDRTVADATRSEDVDDEPDIDFGFPERELAAQIVMQEGGTRQEVREQFTDDDLDRIARDEADAGVAMSDGDEVEDVLDGPETSRPVVAATIEAEQLAFDFDDMPSGLDSRQNRGENYSQTKLGTVSNSGSSHETEENDARKETIRNDGHVLPVPGNQEDEVPVHGGASAGTAQGTQEAGDAGVGRLHGPGPEGLRPDDHRVRQPLGQDAPAPQAAGQLGSVVQGTQDGGASGRGDRHQERDRSPLTHIDRGLLDPDLQATGSSLERARANVRAIEVLRDLDVPDCEVVSVAVEATEAQKQAVDALVERAELVRDGAVDPSDDNMLNITNDGRKVSLDPKLLDVSDPDIQPMEGGKVQVCAEKIHEIWREHAEEKATQLVFCDSSTTASGKWNIQSDLKRRLVDLGIPEDEIMFAAQEKDPQKKQALFEKVRKGEVRVLIGSTGTLGTGTNVQDRLFAIHDLDCPWKPAELEQRQGRVRRQGNMFDNVQDYRYVTVGTFDSYMFQTVERKARFISQIMSSGSPSREASDVDATVLSLADMKAIATGDPNIAKRMELENQLTQMKLLKRAHADQQRSIRFKIDMQLQPTVDNLERLHDEALDDEPKFREAVEIRGQHLTRGICGLDLGNGPIMDRRQAIHDLIGIARGLDRGETREVGEYCGLTVMVASRNMAVNGLNVFRPFVGLKGEHEHWAGTSAPDINDSADSVIRQLDRIISNNTNTAQSLGVKLGNAKASLESAWNALNQPWEGQKEYDDLTDQIAKMNLEIKHGKGPTPAGEDGQADLAEASFHSDESQEPQVARAAVESGPSGSNSFPATVETTDVPMPDPCVDPCNGGTGMSGLCM